jgi:heme A synthase
LVCAASATGAAGAGAAAGAACCGGCDDEHAPSETMQLSAMQRNGEKVMAISGTDMRPS